MIRSAPMRRPSFKKNHVEEITNKPRSKRKCKICRSEFEPRSAWQKACSPDCALTIAKLDRENKERKEQKARKESIKTRSDYIKEAQAAFNAYIRARDAMQLCISCHVYLPSIYAPSGGKFDCGHYRSVGSAPHLRFNEKNAHGQCKKCNRYGAGRAVDYRIGLIKRIGVQTVEELEAENAPRKWTIEELKQIKIVYKTKLKEMLNKRQG